MKKIEAICIVSVMSILLTGCCLSHDWQEATCTTPKTCAKCGETEGEALGHDWQEATCTEPKTCSVCGETEGKALGHTVTGEATCTEGVLCDVCGAIAIEPLGHKWQEATCQQPLTCSICGVTEGEPLEHIVDGTGYCVMCNEEVGIVLTLDNASKYIPAIGWRDCNEADDIRYYIERDGKREYVLVLEGIVGSRLNEQYIYHDLELTYDVWLEPKSGSGYLGTLFSYYENGVSTAPKVVLTYDDLRLGNVVRFNVEGLNIENGQVPYTSKRWSGSRLQAHEYKYYLHVELSAVKGYLTSNPNYNSTY